MDLDMTSEQLNLNGLYLHIREPHDDKIQKIFRKADHRHAEVILKCLVALTKLLIKEADSKTEVNFLIKEAENLTRKFMKNKHLTAKFEIRSKFEEIKNLIISCPELSKSVQTKKFVDTFLLKFNKF